MINTQTNNDMTTQIRTSIESYLSKEKMLRREIEKYQIASECEFDEADVLSSRIDIMEANLIKEVKVNALAYKMTEIDFISLVNAFENRRN